jgi:hypothetical protein
MLQAVRWVISGLLGLPTEPIDSIDQALNDIEEGIDDPVLLPMLELCPTRRIQMRPKLTVNHCPNALVGVCRLWFDTAYLGIIGLAGAEECVKGIVSGNDETGKVDKEIAANVEEDEKEVEADKTKEGVDLGHAGLLLEVVEGRILGELERTVSIYCIEQLD